MDKSTSTKFGHILNKYYRGQVRKIHGRTFKFADREARHSTSALELLKIDPLSPEAPEPEPPATVEVIPDEGPIDDGKPPF